MKGRLLLIYILVILYVTFTQCSSKFNAVEEFSDSKLFKQLLRTRTNVMVLFTQSRPPASSVYKAYKEAAEEVRGIGTMVAVDCSGAGQKLCRQLKAAPVDHLIHHYKDGKFHKVYDRQVTTKSLVRFMSDPTGDLPWEEEPSGKSVVHLDSPSSLSKLLKKHKRALVMFYAPWCVYCKQMKPEYAAAAGKVRASGLGVLAAMDVVRTENSGMRTKYNITGFPTVYYFKNGEIIATYEGENKEDKIVEFMKDPMAVPAKPKEVPWSEEEPDLHHLTTENFDLFLEKNPSTLVMFYAPWCGHCKRLKPDWAKASRVGSKLGIDGVVAAVDATKETALAERFKVKGFPTIKYFKEGEFAFDTPNLRDHKNILDFLRDPKEPPPAPPPEPNWSDVQSEVVHLTEDTFKSQLRSKRHALVMFYAPWCGHCKAAKPEFEAAAEQLKDEPRMVLAAVNCVENQALCKLYEVQGYPTFKYFKYHKGPTSYDGGRKAADFVKFLTSLEADSLGNSPQPAISATEEVMLDKMKSDQEAMVPGWGRLLHLDDNNYKSLMAEHKNLFIMFHAKWCRYCREAKPVYADLAADLDSNVATLADCDTDKSPTMVDDFRVDNLPAFKYVRDGKPIANFTGERTAASIKQFLLEMKSKQKDEL